MREGCARVAVSKWRRLPVRQRRARGGGAPRCAICTSRQAGDGMGYGVQHSGGGQYRRCEIPGCRPSFIITESGGTNLPHDTIARARPGSGLVEILIAPLSRCRPSFDSGCSSDSKVCPAKRKEFRDILLVGVISSSREHVRAPLESNKFRDKRSAANPKEISKESEKDSKKVARKTEDNAKPLEHPENCCLESGPGGLGHEHMGNTQGACPRALGSGETSRGHDGEKERTICLPLPVIVNPAFRRQRRLLASYLYY
jgi:hypothetical protein